MLQLHFQVGKEFCPPYFTLEVNEELKTVSLFVEDENSDRVEVITIKHSGIEDGEYLHLNSELPIFTEDDGVTVNLNEKMLVD